MTRHSCLTDLAALKDWYELLETPTWNLYRGFFNKMPINAIYKQTNDQMPLLDSWALLERTISVNSSNGGQFTIYVPAPGGKGYVQHVSINMQQAGGMGYGQQSAGLGGIPGQAVAMGFVSPDELTRRINDEREKWEMKRELEDMRAAMESATNWQDIAMAKIMEIDPNTIMANLGGFLKQLMQPRPGLQLRGMAGEMITQTATEQAEEGQGVPFQYDLDRMVPAFDLMRQHYDSDEEFITDFIALAQIFAGNPAFFKAQIKAQIKNNGTGE